jgi:hypothetical protein
VRSLNFFQRLPRFSAASRQRYTIRARALALLRRAQPSASRSIGVAVEPVFIGFFDSSPIAAAAGFGYKAILLLRPRKME